MDITSADDSGRFQSHKIPSILLTNWNSNKIELDLSKMADQYSMMGQLKSGIT